MLVGLEVSDHGNIHLVGHTMENLSFKHYRADSILVFLFENKTPHPATRVE
jgi:hypothetical protein